MYATTECYLMRVTANAGGGSQTPTLSRPLGLMLASSMQMASGPVIEY